MGMFDYVRCSYPINDNFTEQCQTKDIEYNDIGGTMSQYWISPSGCLYHIDYSNTADFVEISDDEVKDAKHKWLKYRWESNGLRGRVKQYPITKYVVIYPEKWSGEWRDWPECRIHFRFGILQDYEVIKKGDYIK
jgi:hypothetical protein